MSVVAFDKARNIREEDGQERTVEIDLAHVEHVRRLTVKQIFFFVGTQMGVDLPANEIADKFNQAGIGVYVLTDYGKDDVPVIIPVANVDRAAHWDGITSVYLKRAEYGISELLVREKPADFIPWQSPIPPAL